MKLRLKHPAWRRRATAVAQKLAHLYFRTCSFSLKVHPEARELLESGRPVVGTCWHGQLLAVLYFFSPLDKAHNYLARFPPLVIMASPSQDGEFIAEVARRWGLIVCLGSRRKGGVQALYQLAAYLHQGHRVALVADGSRGPARKAQKGVLFLARQAQIPILPVAMTSNRKITFNTWDHFELPFPCSQIVLLVGQPMVVNPGVRGPALELLRQQLETRLNELGAIRQAITPQ